MPKIKKILVANRAEIAVRVIRTAREMGIQTVAVYSDADRNSVHVRLADQAVYIGASPSTESYLDGKKIIEAALQTKAQAIHPGYGFLSENAGFARQVKKHGLIFIGPSEHSISVMGNKLRAKKAVSKNQIPLIPGTEKPITKYQDALKAARKIGFPVLIKASAGGGGKGMRIVSKEEELKTQLERAMSESKSAFGDDSFFLEKYFTSPRHIEIQVLADQAGNTVHLFERECSIQRRHQKIIEESPSPVVNPGLRKRMGEAAVKVAQSCKYYGAGTVEFLVDENLQFYFLEMNTRLQVEHPVTEGITGIDLVKEQINIADGKNLQMGQSDIQMKGHAIEARVYAEDPGNDFLPSVGTLTSYRKPHGPGIRVDDGFEEGMEVPIYYDSMIAKLIAYGPDRESARKRILRALREYEISGIETNLDFCRFVFEHPSYIKGEIDTHFVEKHFLEKALGRKPSRDAIEIGAALAAYLHNEHTRSNNNLSPSSTKTSNWKNRTKDD